MSGRDGATSFVTCPRCDQWTALPRCQWCDLALQGVAAPEADVDHRGRRVYSSARGLLRLDLMEQARLLWHLVRWIVLGGVVGVLAGLSSAAFLETLTWATDVRLRHPGLLWLLPVAGFVIGLVYHYGAGSAAHGSALIIDEIHQPRAWVPRRMAPLVYAGTVVTHLFGGSAGREGTALQMSGSLTDLFSRLVRLRPGDRRLLLIAALAGGFGAVFGVPVAGFVFALEVQSVGRLRYDALVPALTASVVGDRVVRAVGVEHTLLPPIPAVQLTAGLLTKVALAGLAFGITAALFIELTHGLRRVAASFVPWPPLRPVLGGCAIIALTGLVGTRDYLGLSLPLVQASVAGGAGIVAGAFALKLLFTAITLGSGFQGGEVTPLFVIGATLGVTAARLLDVPVPLLASIGFVAVFAGAANVPLACTVMGIELFGAAPAVLFAVACSVSYVFSSHRGIYGTQRIDTPKGGAGDQNLHVTLDSVPRRHWLPALRPRRLSP